MIAGAQILIAISYWHPVMLQIVPTLNLVEFPLTVTRLLVVVRGDTQRALLPGVAHADHVDVTENPHPLDLLIPEPHKLDDTVILSMNVLPEVVRPARGWYR